MKTITVKNLDGSNENVEIVYYFDIKDLNKTFAIISKNEKLNEVSSKVYISEVIEETPGMFKFVAITDESIWDNVKIAMKSIIQGNRMDSSKNLSGIVELVGTRVIGIKDTDKEKFANISSSFTIETPAETQEVVETPEVQAAVEQPVEEPVKVENEVHEQVEESVNIFDQLAAASPTEPPKEEQPVDNPVVNETPIETAMQGLVNEPVADVTPSQPVFDVPVVNTELVTPQQLYQKEEETIKDPIEICFDRIRAELMKKDEEILKLKSRINELEKNNINYQNINEENITFKQAA